MAWREGVFTTERFFSLVIGFEPHERDIFASFLEIKGAHATLSQLAQVLVDIEQTGAQEAWLAPQVTVQIAAATGRRDDAWNGSSSALPSRYGVPCTPMLSNKPTSKSSKSIAPQTASRCSLKVSAYASALFTWITTNTRAICQPFAEPISRRSGSNSGESQQPSRTTSTFDETPSLLPTEILAMVGYIRRHCCGRSR
jgi:hypothetical protein